MGRPRKTLTKEQKKQVEQLAGILTVEQLADFLGMGRQTFFDMMKRDKDVSVLYKRGRAKMGAAIGQNLAQQALAGDAVRQMFYLKTQCGWREQKEAVQVDDVAAALKQLAEKLPD